MSSLYAQVGMKGTLQAIAPFDTVIKEKIIYECLCVQSLRGIDASGEDAFTLYYKPYGLTKEVYDLDLSHDINILTFQSYDGQSLQVPSSYVSGLPDPSGVVYQMRALSIPLSALPAGVDLTVLKEDIADLVRARVGVGCTIQELTYGPDISLDDEQHQAVALYRQTQMTSKSSNTARIAQLSTLVDEQAAKIAMLEGYIIDLNSN